MNRLLALGVALRVAIFFLASPFNADDHLAVIDWIVGHRALPVSNLLQQSYHPPLYYLLMTPLRALAPASAWPVHLASLAMSCATLVLLRRLMDDPLVVAANVSRAVRVATFALVATLPQLAMFGSFISNDPPSQLIGTLLFVATLRYAREPTFRRLIVLAVLVGLGLLTKGTFLLSGFALAPVVWRIAGPRRAVIFCCAWLALGSFKYVDNAARLGRPFVHNQEMNFRTPYARSIWHGPSTIYDVNVATLVRYPVIRPGRPTSYPLMLYATFWYAHLGDSSFRGNVSGYDAVGRATYALAVAPTLAFLLGCAAAIVRLPSAWRGRAPADVALAAALALFVANLVVIVAAGVRFDVWEAFQGRLLFPSIGPMAVLFLLGTRRLPTVRAARGAMLACCWGVVACGVLYFLVEFALAGHLLNVDETLLNEVGRR